MVILCDMSVSDIGFCIVEYLFVTEIITRQELVYRFIPFLIQHFRDDKFLFGDFERWRKILSDEKITEFDFDWNELKNEGREYLARVKMFIDLLQMFTSQNECATFIRLEKWLLL